MEPRPIRLLVDTDPSLLTWGLDVDDDLALLFLLGSPEVELLGVTTTYGNTLGSFAYRDARRLLALCGRTDLPVLRGAGFFARDTRESGASRFLVEMVSRHPGEITLLTLGPLTNLAAALRRRPDLAANLRELVILGGRSSDGHSEFNFRADPASADAVLAAEGSKTVVPFDLGLGLAITPEDAGRLAADPASVISRFAPKLRRFARIQDGFRALQGRAPGQVAGGFHPWDVVAAAWLVEPALFGGVRDVVHRVDGKGRSRLTMGPGAKVRMPASLDGPRFRELFFERVARPRLAARPGKREDPGQAP